MPGSPDCFRQDYQYPSLNFLNWTVPVAEDWLAKKHITNPNPFHWSDFQHQNEKAKEIFRASGIDFVVMDAYKVNILRPDGHSAFDGKRDCLHGCLGSKIDVYSQLLLHIIKLHKRGLLPTR